MYSKSDDITEQSKKLLVIQKFKLNNYVTRINTE